MSEHKIETIPPLEFWFNRDHRLALPFAINGVFYYAKEHTIKGEGEQKEESQEPEPPITVITLAPLSGIHL